MAFLSVIVPVYKVEKYIRECISSLVNCTNSNLEIIIVDDGSPDNSINLIEDLINKDPRIILLRKENGGVSSARNLGLKHASGKFITFIDSDDWVEKDFFEQIEKDCKSNPSIILYGYYKEVHNNQQKMVLDSNNEIKGIGDAIIVMEKSGLFLNFPWNKVYRRDILQNVFFDDKLTYCEDLVFNSKVFQKIDSVKISSNIYYHYRITDLSLTNNSFYKNYYEISKRAIIARNELYEYWNLKDSFNNILLYKNNEYILGGIINLYRPKSTFIKKERIDYIKCAKKEYKKTNIKLKNSKLKLVKFCLIFEVHLCDIIYKIIFKIYNKTHKKK